MKENLLGIDVGGTKCAIIYGIKENDELHIIDKKKFEYDHSRRNNRQNSL